MSWKSIDESEPVVVLRGLPATVPQSYERFYGPRRRLTFGFLVLCLHRIISWSIAGAAHLIVAAALLALYLQVQPEEESLLMASLWRGNAGEEGKKVEAPKPEPPAEEEKKIPEPPVPEPKPEPPKPEPPKPEPVPEPAPKKPDPEPPAPAPNPIGGAPTADPKPATIGGGASSTGPAAKADNEKEVEKDPTGAIRQRRAGELNKLRAGSRKEIVVVTGGYDNVQEVLDRLEIPYTIMDPDRLPHANLSECKILLINCHNTYSAGLFRGGNAQAMQKEIEGLQAKEDALRKRIQQTKDKQAVFRLGLELLQATSRLSELRNMLEAATGVSGMIDNVRRFAEGGGYVFTSDWGISILERAFPGTIRNGGNVGPRTVPIRPRAGKEAHPLLEEVFFAGKGTTTAMRKFLWEIDSASYLIKIDKASVETLVESPDLTRHSAVAVAFSPDKALGVERAGRVLHVLSHFKNQATKQGDYALQNLLLNFMLDRVAPK